MRTFCITLKYVFCFVLLLLLVAFLSLFLFEQSVPQALLTRCTNRLSNESLLFRVDSATFSFARGLKIRGLRLLDRKRPGSQPIISARLVDLELDCLKLPLRTRSLIKSATITDLKYPRLPEGYYIPDSIEFPGQPDFREVNEPVSLTLPEIDSFPLTLIQPDILSITPRKVFIQDVHLTRTSMQANGIDLRWADSDVPMRLDGEVALDLEDQLVKGEVHGHARQHNIRPLLVALDITNSYQFIDAFTKVEPPVDARCEFDVNLRNNDLHIFLDLKPEGGCHHKVPLKNTVGTVDIRVFVRDTFQNARIVVGPLTANLADGTKMDGTIVYSNTNDVGYVDFDVRSNATMSNALAIADTMTDGTLDCLVTETPPQLTLKGRLAVDPTYALRHNDLHGTVAFERGSFFSIPLRNAFSEFHLKGTDLTFSNAHAHAPHGGTLTGSGALSIPDFKQDHATFSVSTEGKDLTLKDLADVFEFDLGDRHGTVNGNITLSGPLSTNVTAHLNGGGRFVCKDAHLFKMNLFSGLIQFLVGKIPGLSALVAAAREKTSSDAKPTTAGNQNCALDFTLTNGVFKTSNLVVDGSFFSIHAEGAYNIPQDQMDFKARVTLTRNDSFFGKLTTPITWPFSGITKFFEFKVYGSLDNPQWEFEKNIINNLKSTLKK